MKYLDLTLKTPAENLALDEALLDLAESGSGDECLRVWEPETTFVVLGCSNHANREARIAECQDDVIPVLRRSSGGGAILQGAGCFNYAVILANETRGFRNVTLANRFVMEKHRILIQKLTGKETGVQGVTDLTLEELKFSGNAQRRKKRYTLVHGTFLLDFDLSLMPRYLSMPSRMPDYRRNRDHAQFLMQLPVSRKKLKSGLQQAWQTRTAMKSDQVPSVKELVSLKYGNPDWNFKY